MDDNAYEDGGAAKSTSPTSTPTSDLIADDDDEVEFVSHVPAPRPGAAGAGAGAQRSGGNYAPAPSSAARMKRRPEDDAAAVDEDGISGSGAKVPRQRSPGQAGDGGETGLLAGLGAGASLATTRSSMTPAATAFDPNRGAGAGSGAVAAAPAGDTVARKPAAIPLVFDPRFAKPSSGQRGDKARGGLDETAGQGAHILGTLNFTSSDDDEDVDDDDDVAGPRGEDADDDDGGSDEDRDDDRHGGDHHAHNYQAADEDEDNAVAIKPRKPCAWPTPDSFVKSTSRSERGGKAGVNKGTKAVKGAGARPVGVAESPLRRVTSNNGSANGSGQTFSAPGAGVGASSSSSSAAAGPAAASSSQPVPSWDGVVNPPPPASWPQPSSWVIFSDLHVTHRSKTVCLGVLDLVYEAAESRSAGIIFLGDFWDRRGQLLVSLLNSIQERLRPEKWAIPTILLVGNHDQVELGGVENALRPLAACNREWIHLVEAPMVWGGALWLPYRRRPQELREILTQLHRRSNAEGHHLHAVFAHADIVGARMSGSMRATIGLGRDEFPAGLPVYTGHYHGPQTLPASAVVGAAGSITYVGSPYQVTAAEAGERKRLHVLRSGDWKAIAEVAIDVGPRHFTMQGPTAAPPVGLRAGDRLVWTVDSLPAKFARRAFDAVVDELRSRRQVVVTVNVARARSAAGAGDHAAVVLSDTSPRGILQQYAASQAGVAAGIDNDVIEKALEFVDGGDGAGTGAGARSGSAAGASHTWISIDSVTLEGYGPFKEKVTYNLRERGLVVLTGDNGAEAATDSNGSGKTSLAYSALWAFGASMQARGGAGALNNSLQIHDDAADATVTVAGRAGSTSASASPFEVVRTVAKKGSSKAVTWKGEIAKSSVKDADAHQRKFLPDVDTLEAAAFFRDSNVTGLLDLNDTEFKKRLETALQLNVWEMALKAVKARERESKEQLVRQEERVEMFQQRADEADAEVGAASDALAAGEANKAATLPLAQQLLRKLSGIVSGLNRLQNSFKTVSTQRIVDADKASEQVGREADAHPEVVAAAKQWKAMLQEVDDASEALGEHKDALTAARTTHDISLAKQQQFVRVMRTTATSGGASGPTCDTCGQTIDAAHAKSHKATLQAAAAEAEAAVAAAKRVWDSANATLKSAEERCTAAKQKLDQTRNRVASEVRQRLKDSRDRDLQQAASIRITEALAVGRGSLTAGAAEPAFDFDHRKDPADSGAAPSLSDGLDLSAADGLLQRCQQTDAAAKRAMYSYNRAVIDADAAEKTLKKAKSGFDKASTALTKENDALKQLSEEQELLARVKEVLGPKGVTGFAVSSVLRNLEDRSNEILESLCGGELQLELSASQDMNKIQKRVLVRTANGDSIERDLAGLSAGERRRVGLALTIAFVALLRDRGTMQCELLVLDEALQHLDQRGVRCVLDFLSRWTRGSDGGKAGPSTVIITSQRFEAVVDLAGAVDKVVKRNGISKIEHDPGTI